MNCMMKSILVVEKTGSDPLRIVEVKVQNMIYQIMIVSDYLEAAEICDIFKPDLFLIRDQLSAISSTTLCNQLHALPGIGDVPTIFIMNDLLQCMIEQAITERQVVDPYKSFDLNTFLVTLDELVTDEKWEPHTVRNLIYDFSEKRAVLTKHTLVTS